MAWPSSSWLFMRVGAFFSSFSYTNSSSRTSERRKFNYSHETPAGPEKTPAGGGTCPSAQRRVGGGEEPPRTPQQLIHVQQHLRNVCLGRPPPTQRAGGGMTEEAAGQQCLTWVWLQQDFCLLHDAFCPQFGVLCSDQKVLQMRI